MTDKLLLLSGAFAVFVAAWAVLKVARAGVLLALPRGAKAPARGGPNPLDRRLAFCAGLMSYRLLGTSVLMTGRTGSGKSSVLLRLVEELLADGCGMYLPASKPGDCEIYLRLCERAGRKDVDVVSRDADPSPLVPHPSRVGAGRGVGVASSYSQRDCDPGAIRSNSSGTKPGGMAL